MSGTARLEEERRAGRLPVNSVLLVGTSEHSGARALIQVVCEAIDTPYRVVLLASAEPADESFPAVWSRLPGVQSALHIPLFQVALGKEASIYHRELGRITGHLSTRINVTRSDTISFVARLSGCASLQTQVGIERRLLDPSVIEEHFYGPTVEAVLGKCPSDWVKGTPILVHPDFRDDVDRAYSKIRRWSFWKNIDTPPNGLDGVSALRSIATLPADSVDPHPKIPRDHALPRNTGPRIPDGCNASRLTLHQSALHGGD